MIIPPDPEKDPRLFDPSSSTPSLLPPPTESDGTAVSGDGGDIGNRNAAFGYPGTGPTRLSARDDLGLGYSGEYLPPYERERRSSRDGTPTLMGPTEMRERDRDRRRSPAPLSMGHIIVPTLQGGFTGTGSGMGESPIDDCNTPTSTSAPSSSTAHLAPKAWEGSESTTAVASSNGNSNSTGKGKVKRLFRKAITLGRYRDKEAKQIHIASGGLHPLASTSSRSASSTTSKASKAPTWWTNYRRWIMLMFFLLLLGLGLMIGLLVGFKKSGDSKYSDGSERQYASNNGPAWHDTEPSEGRRNTVWADGSMNLTWVPSRDSPPSSDGNLTICNIFTPLNASNFSSLVTPYPANKLYSSTFLLPLRYFNTSTNSTVNLDSVQNYALNLSSFSASSDAAAAVVGDNTVMAYGRREEIPIISRGIASSGTIEFIGADAEADVINGAAEGMIRIDVVMQYGGYQEIQDQVRVCEIVQPSGAMGVGIYTPTQTDGKITNPYMLDPTLLPSFHVIVRFPPSVVWSRAASLLPSDPSTPAPPPPLRIRAVNISADAMGLRIGDLDGIADFGRFTFDSKRGSVAVDYLAARNVWIGTAENSVRGRFNVSESLYINSTDSSIIADVILHDPNQGTNTTLEPTAFMYKRQSGDDHHSDDDASSASFSSSRYGNGPGQGQGTKTRGGQTSAWSATPSPTWTASPNYASPSPSASASSSSDGDSDASQLVSGMTNATMSNVVNTTFYTTDGLVQITYLAHPPRTGLTSWIATNQGEMDISFHPNFSGAFAIRNAWGAIRLPPPKRRLYDDPLGIGRRRAVVEGVISVRPQQSTSTSGSTGQQTPILGLGIFERAGLNGTLLSTSGTTVTGAAYWQDGANGTLSPKAVQESAEGRRGAAVILGGWGDVRVVFDGR